MPRVYVAQESMTRDRETGQWVPRDLSSAHRYGTIHYVLTQRDQPSLAPGPTLNKAQSMLRDFKPDDYILSCGGDPAALAIVTTALKELGFRRVNYLRWDKEIGLDGRRTGSGFYTPTIMPLE